MPARAASVPSNNEPSQRKRICCHLRCSASHQESRALPVLLGIRGSKRAACGRECGAAVRSPATVRNECHHLRSSASTGSSSMARNVRSIDTDCVQCGNTPSITKELDPWPQRERREVDPDLQDQDSFLSLTLFARHPTTSWSGVLQTL